MGNCIIGTLCLSLPVPITDTFIYHSLNCSLRIRREQNKWAASTKQPVLAFEATLSNLDFKDKESYILHMQVEEINFIVQEALRRPHDETFTIKRAALPPAEFQKQSQKTACGNGEGLRDWRESLHRGKLGQLTPALLGVSVELARIQPHLGN